MKHEFSLGKVNFSQIRRVGRLIDENDWPEEEQICDDEIIYDDEYRWREGVFPLSIVEFVPSVGEADKEVVKKITAAFVGWSTVALSDIVDFVSGTASSRIRCRWTRLKEYWEEKRYEDERDGVKT